VENPGHGQDREVDDFHDAPLFLYDTRYAKIPRASPRFLPLVVTTLYRGANLRQFSVMTVSASGSTLCEVLGILGKKGKDWGSWNKWRTYVIGHIGRLGTSLLTDVSQCLTNVLKKCDDNVV
jgi:hypothetical protein